MKTGKITLTAIFAASAIALSTLESLVPIGMLIPVPGLKLGIANIAVMACFHLLGKRSGAAAAIIKTLVVFLTFGNVTSFVISLSGTTLAYISLIFTKPALGKHTSFIGISCISAVFHAVGQVIAATFLTGSSALATILLPLGLCSVVTGAICGFILNYVYPAIKDKVKI